MNMLSDIWQGILNKDPASWSRLVHQLTPLVYTVARRVSLSSFEADDCAQQTWIALYRARHQIKDPQKLPAWLIRTASRNAARIAQGREGEVQVLELLEVASELSLPDEELEMLETAALVHLALESLDPRCRRLLHALYLAPMKKKYSQISNDLGISPNSFGPTRSRCLKKLGRILDGYDLE